MEFLDAIEARGNADTAGSKFVVVIAVEQPVGAVGAGTANRERVRAACGNFAAWAAIEKAARIGFLRGAWRERGKLHEIAAVQGELRDFLRGDHLAESGVGGLHGNSVRDNFDCGGNRGGIVSKIQFA